MDSLNFENVKPGQTLSHFIYASSGRLLLTAGVPISAEDIPNLKVWSKTGVYSLTAEEHKAVLLARREGVSYDPSKDHKVLRVDGLQEGDRIDPDTYKVLNAYLWVQEDKTLTADHIGELKKITNEHPDKIYQLEGDQLLDPKDFVTVAVGNFIGRVKGQRPARTPRVVRKSFESERTETRQKLEKVPSDSALGVHFKRTPTPWTPQRVSQVKKVMDESADQFEQTLSSDQQTGAPRLGTGALRNHRQIVAENLSVLMNDGNVLLGVLNKNDENSHVFAHGCKVSVLATEVSIAMNLIKQDVLDVGVIALLQDVGMVRVPEAIVTKGSPLSPQEFAEIRKHPLYSTEMVSTQSSMPRIIPEVIGQIHERLDGTGYPQGLKGSGIHKFAKIISPVDTYIAMTSPRPYRPPMLPYQAIVVLLRSAYHKLYDRDVVKTLISCLSLCPIGTIVQLNTQEVGEVIASHREALTRPVVRLLYDKDGNRIPVERVVDLKSSDDMEILRTIRSEDIKDDGGRMVLADGAKWQEVGSLGGQ